MTGQPTLACITEDGVLLRAITAGRVLLEALRLSYATQDSSMFHIPDDYRRIQPAPAFGIETRAALTIAGGMTMAAFPRAGGVARRPRAVSPFLKAATLVLVLLPGADLALAWAWAPLAGGRSPRCCTGLATGRCGSCC